MPRRTAAQAGLTTNAPPATRPRTAASDDDDSLSNYLPSHADPVQTNIQAGPNLGVDPPHLPSAVHTPYIGNANTLPIFYFSTMTIPTACKEPREAIVKHCHQDRNGAKSKAAVKGTDQGGVGNAKRDASLATDAVAKPELAGKGKKPEVNADGTPKPAVLDRTENNAWVHDHCDGLWFKPFNNVSSKVNNLEEYKKALQQQGAAKTAAAAAATGDAQKALKAEAKEINAAANAGKPLSNTWANAMDDIAKSNPCIKAKKCSLVPYKPTKSAEDQAKKGDGCCPGQTGHHLMPDTMFRDPAKKKPKTKREDQPTLDCWGKYTEDGAPTICVEGTTNNSANGSHGRMHELTDEKIAPHTSKKEMSYATARNLLADLVEAQFGCPKECTKAQLDEFYKGAYTCTDPAFDKATVVPDSGKGGKKKPAAPPAGTQVGGNSGSSGGSM